jgi:hypothetical protein
MHSARVEVRESALILEFISFIFEDHTIRVNQLKKILYLKLRSGAVCCNFGILNS